MIKNQFNINGREIGTGCTPYIIAEMSANHNGNIDNAFLILKMAKRAGADAVKMQTYTADTITLNCDKPDFQINDGLWKGQNLHQLYQEAYTPWDWHKPLFDLARELDITMFSTPFDNTAVDYLEDLNVPAYKIASFECIDLPLIKYVATTGKPMIISTGMANISEIEEAVECAKENGCTQLALLHCVSGYPAPSADYNLKTITDMAEKFQCTVGLSDHTLNNVTAISSIGLGASIIEKHVTLDRNGGGPDDSFSLEEGELTQLCTDSKIAWEALGKVNYEQKDSEKSNIKFRRSLYAVKDIAAGEELTADNVKSIRPGYGLPPKNLEKVLGSHVLNNIEAGTGINWSMIDKNE